MKIVFSEPEAREKDLIKRRLEGHELVFIDEPLSLRNISLFKDADILSVFVASKIDKEIISNMQNLKMIATRSTGFDHIDLETAKSKGVVVCNVPRYGENTVAEHTFALLLALIRHVVEGVEKVKNGVFSPKGLRGYDLKGKTIGVIGTGNIGRNVIKIAKGFGMKVLAYDVKPSIDLAHRMGFTYTSLEDIYRRSDILSFHVPLFPSTRHMFNKDSLKLVKKGVFIVNTSRGPVVDSEALLIGLKEGIIAGAALDVLEGESEIKEELELLGKGNEEYKLLALDYMLIHHPRVIVTPHNAFNTYEALERICNTTLDNILAFIEGRPINRVI